MEQRRRQLIRPYGDRMDDGVVQLAFCLPVPVGPNAREAAAQYVKMLGFQHVLISCMEPAGDDYSFFVAYGRSELAVDYGAIQVPKVVKQKRSFDELNQLISRELGRRIVVVGACIGTDAHAVGIDAIMNMKGYAGDYGLERYPQFRAINLGAQVEPAALVERAKREGADAILVSQVVTQREIHKENARQVVEAARQAGLYGKVLLIFGGPRVDHATALEVGFDAGFGPGTRPSEVANYLCDALLERLQKR